MAEVASAFVSLLPSAKGFGSKLDSQIQPEVKRSGDNAGKTFGGGLLGGFKGIAVGLGAAFAATGAISFVRDSVQGFQDHLKVAALTAQAIKSTGSAAKVTAAQVGSLSDALEAQTGVDGDLIQNGANLLLTFTNVRNEVGKGNDIFNQATKTIVDMSVALGQDTKGSAIQLGKALNDPIKGVTALSKVGVSFTQQQKDQIKTLVDSGKTLDAQKVILAELNKEFGGAAEAAANPVDRMIAVFHGLQDQIGAAFLPLLNKTADFLGQTFIPAVQDFIQQFQDGKTFLNPFADGLANIKDAVVGLFDLFVKGDYTGTLGRALGVSEDDEIVAKLFTIRDAITGIFDFLVKGDYTGALGRAFGLSEDDEIVTQLFALRDGFFSALGQVRDFISTQVVPAVGRIVTAVSGFYQTVIPIVIAFAQQFYAKIQPLMPQVMQIFGTIKDIVVSALTLVAQVISSVTQAIAYIWRNWGDQITSAAAFAFKAIIGVVGPALTVIKNLIQFFTNILQGNWSGAFANIRAITDAQISAVKSIISTALTVIKTLFQFGLSALASIASAAFNGVKAAVAAGITNAVNLIRGLPGQIASAIGDLGSVLYNAGAKLIDGLIDGIRSRIPDVTGAVSNIAGTIKGFFPGSPVKTGPLTSWNNGGAGKRLVNMLVSGLSDTSSVARASSNLASAVNLRGSVSTTGVGYGTGASVDGLGGGIHIENLYAQPTADEIARKLDTVRRNQIVTRNLRMAV